MFRNRCECSEGLASYYVNIVIRKRCVSSAFITLDLHSVTVRFATSKHGGLHNQAAHQTETNPSRGTPVLVCKAQMHDRSAVANFWNPTIRVAVNLLHVTTFQDGANYPKRPSP